MTAVGADTALRKQPHSLLRFLVAWVASYVGALLLTAAAIALLVLPPIVRDPDSAGTVGAIAWLSVFPAGLAFGQWLLMRRYLANALPWASATFAAALLAQLSSVLVPEARGDSAWPDPAWFFDVLSPIVGFAIAADVATVFARGVCFGAAWAIPPALAFPGPRSTRIVWVVALMSTGFLLVVMVQSLPRNLLRALFYFYDRTGFWIPSMASRVLPALLAWLILSLIGGAIMYWGLRRGSTAAANQVYARFD